MVHQYKNNGYNIVMDICSGAIHVVDDVVYDVVALFEDNTLDAIKEQLPYGESEVEEAYQEVQELKEQGLLFTDDIYEDYIKEVKERRPLSRLYVFTLPMTVTLPAAIVLRRRENIKETGR